MGRWALPTASNFHRGAGVESTLAESIVRRWRNIALGRTLYQIKNLASTCRLDIIGQYHLLCRVHKKELRRIRKAPELLKSAATLKVFNKPYTIINLLHRNGHARRKAEQPA